MIQDKVLLIGLVKESRLICHKFNKRAEFIQITYIQSYLPCMIKTLQITKYRYYLILKFKNIMYPTIIAKLSF